ncbi:MAG TPA: ABC transporter permease [Burkholderiaceae bacterium]|jgi:NitT/TauT family transport system permease protein|nr:ABC transporter permease [Burkholderiaceae bacterium]
MDRGNDSRWVTAAWSVGVLVVFLLLWEYAPRLLGIPEFVLPSFSKTLTEAGRIASSEQLGTHMGITALEVVVGFALGALMGAVIGYALGLSPRVEAILSPYLLALQIAPKVAFAPLFVMWLGYTVYPKILVAILIVFFPVLINVLTAMRTMDGDLVNLARSFSATRWQVFRNVEFPTTLPALFSGLRIASTLAVIGVVVGELVGGNMGLGYLLVFFEGQGNTAGVFVVIALLTVIGIAAYYAVVLAERRVLHYLPTAERRLS